MHPFDLKSALLAKHAQHVVLIHFPIALFLTGAAFDLAARWTKNATKRPALAAAAYLRPSRRCCFCAAGRRHGHRRLAVATGGAQAQGSLDLHPLSWGAPPVSLFVSVEWIHFQQHQASDSALPSYRLPLELLTAVVIVLTGFTSADSLVESTSRVSSRRPRRDPAIPSAISARRFAPFHRER